VARGTPVQAVTPAKVFQDTSHCRSTLAATYLGRDCSSPTGLANVGLANVGYLLYAFLADHGFTVFTVKYILSYKYTMFTELRPSRCPFTPIGKVDHKEVLRERFNRPFLMQFPITRISDPSLLSNSNILQNIKIFVNIGMQVEATTGMETEGGFLLFLTNPQLRGGGPVGWLHSVDRGSSSTRRIAGRIATMGSIYFLCGMNMPRQRERERKQTLNQRHEAIGH